MSTSTTTEVPDPARVAELALSDMDSDMESYTHERDQGDVDQLHGWLERLRRLDDHVAVADDERRSDQAVECHVRDRVHRPVIIE